MAQIVEPKAVSETGREDPDGGPRKALRHELNLEFRCCSLEVAVIVALSAACGVYEPGLLRVVNDVQVVLNPDSDS
jgi:hypothetical protein